METTSKHKELDRETSQRFAQLVKPEIKQCYHNAWRCLAYTDEDANVRYIEGFISDLGFAFEHGWLEIDGKIVDPTAILWEGERSPVYFAGFRYTKRAAYILAVKNETLPLYTLTYGLFPQSDDEYRQAHDSAWLSVGVDFNSIRKKPDDIAQIGLITPKVIRNITL